MIYSGRLLNLACNTVDTVTRNSLYIHQEPFYSNFTFGPARIMSKGAGKWANRVLDDTDIERTPEYEEFMKKVREYHEKRG